MNLYLIAIAAGLSISFFVILLMFFRSSRQSELLAEVTSQAYRTDAGDFKPAGFDIETLTRPLGAVRKLFGGAPNPEIVRRLLLAGYRKPFHVDVFFGMKLILPAFLGVAVALFIRESIIIFFILAVLIGFFFPDFWLTYAINKRRQRIGRSLPDTLDLLAICMEAGLGLDQAIVRVGTELQLSHPELSQELLQINLEQRAGNPRIGAWRNMADRVDLLCRRSALGLQFQGRWQFFLNPCVPKEDRGQKSGRLRRPSSWFSLWFFLFFPVFSWSRQHRR